MHAFVSLPFGESFDPVFETIAKAVTLRGLDALCSTRVPEHTTAAMTSTMERNIRDSRFIIADLTGSHPHVLQEVRYASGLGKPRILISQETPKQAACHVQGLNIHSYDLEDLDRLQSLLRRLIVDLSDAEINDFEETPFQGSLSAKIGLMYMLPAQWKNPFADC
ncbi:hypothetical protein C2W62_10810 [Candidatus Entotheonella serta]|nr:hypothetical protein C2W62_10810 [Candidatus Entotheonella serta]